MDAPARGGVMGEPTKRNAIAVGAGLLGVAIFLGWPRGVAETPPPPPRPLPRVAKPRPTERATPRQPEGPPPATVAPSTRAGGPTVERDERGALTRLRTAEGREWWIDR